MREYQLRFDNNGPCKHERTSTQQTPEGPHYAKVTCLICGMFLRWLPKPETLFKQDEIAKKVKHLAGIGRLTEWEKQFIGTLSTQKGRISPRQDQCLKKLWEKYG